MRRPTFRFLRRAALAALLAACASTKEERRPEPPPPPAPAEHAKPAEPPGTPDAEFRATKPPPLSVTPSFEAPVPTERKLKNGAQLLVYENRQLPLVAVEVVIRTGTNGDPSGKAGLAHFTAAMLDEGTKARSALQLAEALEDLAAWLSASTGEEAIRIQLSCLTEALPEALRLLADVVQNPAFRPEDQQRVLGLLLTELEHKKGTPVALASDEMARLLWGDKHPWGQPEGGTPRSLRSITRQDLAKFHGTWFRPNNATIAVSGDVKVDEVGRLLEESFKGWKPGKLPAIKLPPLPELSRRIVLLDKPGASQSQIWAGGHTIPANHPDQVALRVANYALGGLFTSRLNLNLRENKGYSYGVRSSTRLLSSTGALVAAGGIIAKHTADALREYDLELQRFASGELTDEELTRAKEAYIRSLPALLEKNEAVASALGNLPVLGLPLDYYRTLPQRVAALTGADVARAVSAHLRPARWPMVVVGPADSREGLEKLGVGPVEVQSVRP